MQFAASTRPSDDFTNKNGTGQKDWKDAIIGPTGIMRLSVPMIRTRLHRAGGLGKSSQADLFNGFKVSFDGGEGRRRIAQM